MEQLLAAIGLIAIMIVQAVVPPIPAEVFVIGAVRQFGVWPTALTTGLGLFIGSVVSFRLGWHLKERFARFFSRSKLESVQERLRQHETLLLVIRVLPYNPADLIAYAAGVIKVRPRKFVQVALVTSFVRTAALAWMGAHLGDWKRILQVVSLLGLSAALSYVVVYWRGQSKPHP